MNISPSSPPPSNLELEAMPVHASIMPSSSNERKTKMDREMREVEEHNGRSRWRRCHRRSITSTMATTAIMNAMSSPCLSSSTSSSSKCRRRDDVDAVDATSESAAASRDNDDDIKRRSTNMPRSSKQQQRMQQTLLPLPLSSLSLLLTIILIKMATVEVSAHGYLKSPRSRNLVAYQDKNWESPDGNDPKPEDCPHCLNRGGALAQCGLLSGIHNKIPWERNYDKPLNIRNQPMSANLQGVYQQGSIIEIEVLVTTHHKGHFEFSICPIENTVPMPIPTLECFEENKLEFISDELYGAPPDPQYPERGYIAPASKVQYLDSKEGVQPVVGAYYKMKFRLPKEVAGEVVLLQWYYLTANSCKHEGYAEYDFPEEWGSDVSLYPGLPDCGEVPEDGNGVPEQFWNCAEIRIVGRGSYPAISNNTPSRPTASSTSNTFNNNVNSNNHVDLPPRWTPRPTQRKAWTSGNNNNNAGMAMMASPSGNNNNNAGMAMMASSPSIPRTPRPTPPPTLPQPTTSPTRPQPTTSPTVRPPCANAGSTYYEATEDCTGYYICTAGQMGDVKECAGGNMLYDAAKQMCNWADEVNCGADYYSGFDDGGMLSDEAGTPGLTGPNELLNWEPVPRAHDKTIIGYYASWQWYDRNGLAAPAAFDFSKITRANFAFFQITQEGYIYGTDPWADPITLFGFFDWTSEPGTVHEYCSWDEPNAPPSCMAHKYEEGLIYLAHAAGAEVYPSIGGWSLSDPFPPMAANPEWRANFAQQCVKLIKSYNFDGIDLDWEYPGYEPHSGTPEDTVNFNLLLDDLRAALDELEAETGKYYGITAALPCGPSIIDNQDIYHVGMRLTELNLMTYDFHGSWNEHTGVNAPLYDQEGSPEFSVHGCVNNWLDGGAPGEKINIGFPFYGRSFLKAQHLYEPHEGNDDTMWWMDEGVPQYYNIKDKWNEFTHMRDEQTMTQYAYGKTGMVSYDDERAICDKTEYAQFHNLKGYIIWELSGDLMEDLSTPLLDAANAKLLDPTLDCADLDMSTINTLVAEAHPGPTAGGVGGVASSIAPKVVYYPSYDMGGCLNDGLEPGWLQKSDIFDTLEGCCNKHFSYNENCEEDSPVTPLSEFIVVQETTPQTASSGKLYYPSSTDPACLSDGNQPEWLSLGSMFDNEQECCEHHFPDKDCIGKIIQMKHSVYYPSSTETICLDDGNQPSWLPASSMFSTEKDCCEHHFPDHGCIGGVNVVKASTYYPSSTGSVCLSDGNQPEWFPASSMFATEEDCCEHHFPGQDCVGKAHEEKMLLYYPSSLGAECVRDGNQPSHLTEDSMFETLEECCKHHYEWKPDCVTSDDRGNFEATAANSTPSFEALVAQKPVPEPEPQTRPTKPLAPPPTKSPTQDPTTIRPTPNPTTQRPIPQTPRPTGYPTPLPTPQTHKPTMEPTPRPTPDPTARPSNRPSPLTEKPTRYPTAQPTLNANAKFNAPTPPYLTVQSEPTLVQFFQSSKQTPEPTRKPQNRRTLMPTPRLTMNVLSGATAQSEPTMVVYQQPDPTREPTKRPRKQRTPKPTNNIASGESPIAASYFGSPSSSFTIIPPSKPAVVLINNPSPSKPAAIPSNNPSKGKELSLGDKLSNQIQMQKMKPKKQKMKQQKQKQKQKRQNQKQKQKQKQQKKRQKNKQKKRQKENQVKKKGRPE